VKNPFFNAEKCEPSKAVTYHLSLVAIPEMPVTTSSQDRSRSNSNHKEKPIKEWSRSQSVSVVVCKTSLKS